MLKKEFLKTKPFAKVTFSLSKKAIPGAKEVRVLGEFNNWNWDEAPVMKSARTKFSTMVSLPTGKSYQFRYLTDNGIWENDWEADNYISTPYNVENSVVELPAQKGNGKAKADTTTKPKKAAIKNSGLKKSAKKDDLKKIEGIGPKIAGLLNQNDIYSFADLSRAPLKKLKKVLEEAGSRYRMHDPKTWSAQAKLAAKGDWDQLKKWQAELKGGK